MCTTCAWATHQEFFQKVPINVITMYPAIYSMSSLRVCDEIEPHWEFFVISFKRTHWVHCNHIDGYFVKELLMSGSGTCWAHGESNYERTQGVLSKSTHWVSCWVLSKSTQWVHSKSTHWVFWWVLFKSTQWVHSQSTHWVLGWVLLKSTHHGPTGFLVGTFCQGHSAP